MSPSADYLQEVRQQTGADVMFDDDPSPVPGMELIIRGNFSQIEQAVRLINIETGNKVCEIIC